jgi:hypothetical protein
LNRFIVLACAGLLALPAVAHDLITADSAQAYLASADAHRQVIASNAPAARRAQANTELGKMLDEISALLNRDLEAHGRVQGLPSSFLMSELTVRGTPLAFSTPRNRFSANLQYYREALRLAPSGASTADAMFGLVKGHFYDSFTVDPLQPAGQSADELRAQISLAEDFLARYPQHEGREEASFILAIHLMQAARAAEKGGEREAFARRAQAAAEAFGRDYPESMRAAALPRLLEGSKP